MYTVTLKIDDKLYEDYIERLNVYIIGRKVSDKYSLKDFSSTLFKNAVLNLTDDQIIDILKGLEIKEYHEFLSTRKKRTKNA